MRAPYFALFCDPREGYKQGWVAQPVRAHDS